VPADPGSDDEGVGLQAAALLDLLYVGGQGYAVLHLRDVNDRHSEAWYVWPADRQRMLRDAAANRHEDVYMAVLLRDRPNRRVPDSNPLPGRMLWLDVDREDDSLWPKLVELGLPVYQVRSGGSTHSRHLYLDLGELLTGQRLTALASELATLLSTDTAGGNNKLLRVPGTANLKPLKAGRAAGLVQYEGLVLPGSSSGAAVLEGYLPALTRPKRPSGPQPPARPELPGGGPQDEASCLPVLLAADQVRKAFTRSPRHDALLGPLTRLLRLQRQAHRGVPRLLEMLRAEFVAEVAASRGSTGAAEQEFDRACAGSPARDAGRVTSPELCACEVDRLRAQANEPRRFAGRGRRVDQDVYKSLVREVVRRQTLEVSKSQRQMAEDADCTQKTVSKSLLRLQVAGLLRVLSRGREQTRVRLALSQPGMRLGVSTHVPASAGSSVDTPSRVSPVSPAHPVFGSKGLSGGQRLTFEQLPLYRRRVGDLWLVPVGPSWTGNGSLVGRGWRRFSLPSRRQGPAAAGVAEATGQRVDTVRTQLRRLRELRLAVRVEGRWYRTLWDPDRVAEVWGVADVPAKRKARHQRERANFALATWDWRSGQVLGHPLRVQRLLDGDAVRYVDPMSGEVLYEIRYTTE